MQKCSTKQYFRGQKAGVVVCLKNIPLNKHTVSMQSEHMQKKSLKKNQIKKKQLCIQYVQNSGQFFTCNMSSCCYVMDSCSRTTRANRKNQDPQAESAQIVSTDSAQIVILISEHCSSVFSQHFWNIKLPVHQLT